MRALSLLLIVGLAAGCVPKTGQTDEVIVVNNPEVTYEPIVDEEAIAAEKEAKRLEELAKLLEQAPEEGVLIKVFDAGAEPRRELRYAPVAGHSETSRISIDMNMDMNLGGMEIPVIMPVMIMDMEVEVKEVSEEGDITFSTVIASTSVEDKDGTQPGMADAMGVQLRELQGLASDMVMSATGEPIQVAFTVPEGASEQVKAQLQSANQSAQAMNTPLPVEAVGVGATWEVFKRANSNGIGVVEHDSFKLVEMTDTHVTLEYSVTQHLASSDVQLPGLPPETRVDVTEFSSAGSGKVVLPLSGLSADSGSSNVVLDMAMTIDVGQGPQDMTMKMDMSMGQSRPE